MARCQENLYWRVAHMLLWAYLWVVFVLQSVSCDIDTSFAFSVVSLGLFSGSLAWGILRYMREKPFCLPACDTAHSWRWGIAVAGVTLLFLLLYFSAYYPGGISPDTVVQYAQAVGETPYNDWHPVLHTLLFFTLPLKVGLGFGGIVLMQQLYFSLAFGYLHYALARNRCPVVVRFALCLFVWVNPFVFRLMMFPWKDIAQTIFAMLLMGLYIQIIGSKGAWLDRKRHVLLFSLVAVCCRYMRHNAILFVLPLVALVLFRELHSKKRRMQLVCTLLALSCGVKLLYAALAVEKPGYRTLETVGLPATIWSNVMKESPDALPKETSAFLHEVATQEAYEDIFTLDNLCFNALKWEGDIHEDAIDSLSYAQVARITYECFRYAPYRSLEAFARLTDMVYGLLGNDVPSNIYIFENDWHIRSNPCPQTAVLAKQISTFLCAGAGKIVFGSIGLELLAMIIAGAIALSKGRSSFVHALPLICYDFGTMLLLSGRDYRFFMLNLPLWIAVIVCIAQDTRMLPTRKKECTKPCNQSL